MKGHLREDHANGTSWNTLYIYIYICIERFPTQVSTARALGVFEIALPLRFHLGAPLGFPQVLSWCSGCNSS